MRHAVLAVLLSVAARAAEAPRERWSFSPDKAVLNCAPEGGAAKVVVKGLDTRDAFGFGQPAASRLAFASEDATAAALFDYDGSTTTVKYYRGCRRVWTAKVRGLDVKRFAHVSPVYGVFAVMYALVRDDGDSVEYRGTAMLIGEDGKPRAVADLGDGSPELGNFTPTASGRYANAYRGGDCHFFDLKTGRHHMYDSKPTDFIRNVGITDEGKVTVMRVQKVVFPNGLEVPGGEFMSTRVMKRVIKEIGLDQYKQQRYILEVAHEFQF